MEDACSSVQLTTMYGLLQSEAGFVVLAGVDASRQGLEAEAE